MQTVVQQTGNQKYAEKIASKINLLRNKSTLASGGKLVNTGMVGGTVVQWVDKVTNYSSQYDTSRWNADQVIGPPKVYPNYGDRPGAWAMQAIDAQQFIEVQFKEAVFVTQLDIYETYHAGGVKAIKALDQTGYWRTIWKTDHVQVTEQSRIFTPNLAELGCRTRDFRIEIDCSVCNSWVEIDAVQLHGKVTMAALPPPMETLANELEQILNDKKFSDVEFAVEGRIIYAHKAILCARSEYFRAMFSDNMQESSTKKPVEMSDVSYDDFLAVLSFIYTNRIPDTYSCVSLTDLWRVADRYSLPGLKTLTCYIISEKIDENNVVDVYVSAVEKLPVIDDVKLHCMSYMSSNMAKVVTTVSFASLSQKRMLEIIQATTAKLYI